MTLDAYNVYTQYQRTELSYEAKISAVKPEESLSNKKNHEENSEIASLLAPILYTNQNDLSNVEQIRKNILEKILGGFSLEEGEHSLFPNDKYDLKKETNSHGNPYSNGNNHMPTGLYYNASSEYYESTSIEFSAQARIKTPNGEYNIELKFSFTHEFYEKHETEIKVANDKFKNPFDIELDKDDDSLKDLKYLHFLFASYKEEKSESVDIFEELRDIFKQHDKNILSLFNDEDKKDKDNSVKKLDNFKVYQENSNHEFSLIAAQKDGFGIYLANSSSQSSSFNLEVNKNGYSFEASHSSSSSSYVQVEGDLKA